MTKTLIFTIAPKGELWGIWLDGFLIEESGNEEEARTSVAMRIEGVRELPPDFLDTDLSNRRHS